MNGFEYEKVKSRVIFKILDMELNREKLEDLFYDDAGNGFAMTFAILLENEEKYVAVADVSKEMAQMYGYDVKEMRKDAEYNMFWQFPAIFKRLDGERIELGLNEEERDRKSPEDDEEIFVLTNGVIRLGASCLYYPLMCERIAGYLGSGFYVLPTSTYEHMILSERSGCEAAGLEEVLRELNHGEIQEEDILSYKVLYYNRDTKELYRPLDQERREKERKEVSRMQAIQIEETNSSKETMKQRLENYKEKLEEKKHVKQERI